MTEPLAPDLVLGLVDRDLLTDALGEVVFGSGFLVGREREEQVLGGGVADIQFFQAL
jgi:hypothetical protein